MIFKPSNIEGFDDSINLDRSMVVKYFEQGDRVRILEGKYQTELGIVTFVDENNVTMPKVKIESSDIEVSIPSNYLKLRGERDVDDIKAVNQRRKKANATVVPTSIDKSIQDVYYRVGDVVLFHGNKLYGYIIEVNKDFVKIVSEQGTIKQLRLSEIDKKLIQDKKTMSRDGQGNALQMDDVVRVTNRQSPLYDQKGIVKSITKNVLFLWDRNFMTSSQGIFVENPRNTTLCGSEFLQNASNRVKGGLINTNRIQKDKLLNKVVLIINGPFKGQRGRVVHVNGDTATLETSIRAKQVHIPKNDLRDINPESDQRFNDEGDPMGRVPDFEDQMHPAESAYAGNQTAYGGGQTAYDAGKTPLALYTPNYQGDNQNTHY